LYKCACGSTVLAIGIDEVKREIAENGPVETGFYVYEDFFSYKSGVYKHVIGDLAGYHAVMILGWGDGYWIA